MPIELYIQSTFCSHESAESNQDWSDVKMQIESNPQPLTLPIFVSYISPSPIGLLDEICCVLIYKKKILGRLNRLISQLGKLLQANIVSTHLMELNC